MFLILQISICLRFLIIDQQTSDDDQDYDLESDAAAAAAASVKIFTEPFSLFKALFNVLEITEDYTYWLKDTTDRVKARITDGAILNDLFEEYERHQFEIGMPTGSGIEYYAAAQVLETNIKIIEVDNELNIISEENFVDEHSAEENKIELVKYGDHFGFYEKLE